MVVLKTPTAYTGAGQAEVSDYVVGNTGTLVAGPTSFNNMTADTMDNAEFADYNSSGVLWADVTPTYASSVANDSELKVAFDNYIIALKKQALLNKKIEICNAVKSAAGGSATSVARVHLSDNTEVEVDEYLAILNAKLTELQNGDLAKYSQVYTTAKNKVNTLIGEMNSLQDEVNLANEVDKGKSFPSGLFDTEPTPVYNGNQSTTADPNDTYPSESDGRKSTVQKGTGTEGSPLTVSEEILKKYLEDVYGVALKDQESDTTKKANYYNGTTHADIPTYSPTVTKDAIDKSLDYNKADGKIKWKDPLQAPLADGDKNSVEGSPYHDDKTVEFMKKFRDDKVADAKAAYEAAVRAENGQGAVAEDGIVKIYVNLANIGDGTAKEKWQYVADAAVEEGKDFNFYYTSILPSGQTSSLLITSIEFDKDVKQHAFRDIQLDLDVTSESAQVVYNGDVIEATAANATITGAKTTAETYATVDGPVQWAADTTARSENITDKDPNPKADTTVTP